VLSQLGVAAYAKSYAAWELINIHIYALVSAHRLAAADERSRPFDRHFNEWNHAIFFTRVVKKND